jgi:selT/selW/selH-like putative selenoprotein
LSKFAGPTLTFLFCNSWGYRKVFEQFAYAIRERYPDLIVEGDNYPPTAVKALLAQSLSIIKMIIIVLIISGQNPFTWINVNPPGVVTWAYENKIYACMILFFLCNAVENTLISTGAFEVTFNDVPVWSKLETGRIPSPQEIFQIIDNHMRMSPASSRW